MPSQCTIQHRERTQHKGRKACVCTGVYFRAYNKMPRGTGEWGFCPFDKYDTADYLDHVKWFHGKYSEAKKQAEEQMSGNVWVCP